MTNAHDPRSLEERLEWIANWSEPDIDLADAGTAREALDMIRALKARIPKHPHPLDLSTRFPLGCKVIKTSGPEWRGVVVGYYSSSYTPEGLVIECTAEGARGQVHVEPAKRMERDG